MWKKRESVGIEGKEERPSSCPSSTAKLKASRLALAATRRSWTGDLQFIVPRTSSAR